MNVRLHIDRLVLDGMLLSAADRPHLQAAIESELARLIAARGLSPELARGISVPVLRAPHVITRPEKAAQFGASIAGAVYGAVGAAK